MVTRKRLTEVTIPGGLANEAIPVRNDAHKPVYPPNLFKLHTLAAFVGSRGSGKTNACVLLAREYLRAGSFNRVFLIAPTYESNRIFDELQVMPGDIYQDVHRAQDALRDILKKIGEDREAFDAMEKYKDIYRRWRKQPNSVSPEETTILEKLAYQPPTRLPFPSPLIVIDDMSHSDIFSPARSNPFINLCLRHRHIFGGTGATIMMLLQNFRSHGSTPKPLRENIQQWFLWRIRDANVLRTIHSEFANLLEFDTFMNLYNAATAENEHDFLTIDLNPTDKVLQFRKNFDVVLVPSDYEEGGDRKRKRSDVESNETVAEPPDGTL